MELYQLFAVDIVSLACNGVKNDTPVQVLSCEYWDFLSVTLFKTRLQRRCFLVIFLEISQTATLLKRQLRHKYFLASFLNFSACNLIKIETQVQMFFLINFEKFFSLPLCYKRDSSTSVFLWILRNVSARNFIMNETPALVLSCEFCKIF